MEEKLTLIRGDSQEIDVVFTDSDGTAIDLTGKTVFFTVKKLENINTTDDTNAEIAKKITTHTSAIEGKTKITLTPEDTDLDTGDYLYDLQIVSGNNNVISTQRALLVVVQDITKNIQ